MRHARAVVATGLAFPIGVTVGALVGVASGDLLFAMFCFFVVPLPLTMLVFWRVTRRLDWDQRTARRAHLGVFAAAFVGTGLLIASTWLWVADGLSALVFVALPVAALLVTLRTRSALAGVA